MPTPYPDAAYSRLLQPPWVMDIHDDGGPDAKFGIGALSPVALHKIILAICRHFRKSVRIIVRADSGFSRDALMGWMESQPGVDYNFGLARNSRLETLFLPGLLGNGRPAGARRHGGRPGRSGAATGYWTSVTSVAARTANCSTTKIQEVPIFPIDGSHPVSAGSIH